MADFSPPPSALSPPAYAELHCLSNFSFLQGASHPEELVQRAQELGYAALALTDECSLAGVVRAHLEARRLAFPLIIGARLQLNWPDDGRPGPELVVLAQTRRGYGLLSRWITLARRRSPKGRYEALTSDVEGLAPQAPMLAGLAETQILWRPQRGLGGPADEDRCLAEAHWLLRWFGAERVHIALERLLGPQDEDQLAWALHLSALTNLPVVATGAVLMHRRSRKPLQDVLTATRRAQPVSECGQALAPNAEAHLRSRARLAALFPPEALAAAVTIAQRCTFSLDELRYEYPQEIVPQDHSPTSWLRELVRQGAQRRFLRGTPDAVQALIEHELALIAQLQYEPYFLTVADIVQWARDQGILCQGRGSAANSVVCYCLHITEVDPASQSVLFERFISAERREPPDIDVDFEHQRREEVIQYIYRKYGRHRAALTAVVACYRPRSALRDVGRALGVEPDRIDAVAKALASGHFARRIHTERLPELGLDPDSALCRLWMSLSQALMGFPRHLSQHPGGFVIAREDLAELVPVENAAMDGRTVIQWDKDDLDTLGLIKVDVLALGMLSALRRSLAFIAFKQGSSPTNPQGLPAFALQDIPREDPTVYEMLSRGDSVGVFQVESRAQMSMLPRLKPQRFYDLVIEVAIVRPGPIQGGMVHPYLRRRNGEEPVSYPSGEVRQALERTLGVPIFQEQVMQLAMLAADFTPGEADQLRRAMAAWKRKGGLGPFHERLVGRMVAKGYMAEYAESIFRQIEGFGEYGFPESHAASFALLVYASAWIKRHHPDAFLCALLNSLPMGFYAPAQLVRQAQLQGVAVRPVDVHRSLWDTVLEADVEANSGLWPVRLGLSRIAGLSQDAGERLVLARGGRPSEAGFRPFESVEDLTRRAQLDAGDLQALAQSDALRELVGHRRQAVWAVAGVDTRAPALLRQTRTASPPIELPIPPLAEDTLDDYRSLGLSLRAHPLALLREHLLPFKIERASTLQTYPDGRLARASGLVTHRQRPGTAQGVVFVTLEDDTGHINVIVWPQLAERQRQALVGSRLLTVFGVWQCQGEVRHLIARHLLDHTALLGHLRESSQRPDRLPASRDFH